MPTDNVSEPSAGARRAAEREKFEKWAAQQQIFHKGDAFKREDTLPEAYHYFWGITEAAWLAWQASETRCGEMRKALRDAQGMIAFLCCCIHSGESLSAEDERTVDNVIKAIRNALNGGPQ